MRPRNSKPRRSRKPPGSPFAQSWFCHALPAQSDGEFRIRLDRPSGWISVAKTKELMACSAQTVHNLCEEGALEWRWVGYEGAGGKKMVLVDSIQRYITRKMQIHES